ncbi:MAG: hypothetical protein JNL22_08865 [Bacteroidales bacterium]|jgi:hypothetical protein|nr:hypothetical protein [Bacteroidales bacterium]
MKTPLITFMLLIFSTVAMAESTGDNFVVADGITYLCRHMRIGLFRTWIYTPEGSVVKVSNGKVVAYRLNGHQYELQPLIDRSGDTIDYAFMEFIAMRNGNRLYRYCSNCSKYDPLNGEIAPINRVYRYYEFENGLLKLLTRENVNEYILTSFNVRVISENNRKS